MLPDLAVPYPRLCAGKSLLLRAKKRDCTTNLSRLVFPFCSERSFVVENYYINIESILSFTHALYYHYYTEQDDVEGRKEERKEDTWWMRRWQSVKDLFKRCPHNNRYRIKDSGQRIGYSIIFCLTWASWFCFRLLVHCRIGGCMLPRKREANVIFCSISFHHSIYTFSRYQLICIGCFEELFLYFAILFICC